MVFGSPYEFFLLRAAERPFFQFAVDIKCHEPAMACARTTLIRGKNGIGFNEFARTKSLLYT